MFTEVNLMSSFSGYSSQFSNRSRLLRNSIVRQVKVISSTQSCLQSSRDAALVFFVEGSVSALCWPLNRQHPLPTLTNASKVADGGLMGSQGVGVSVGKLVGIRVGSVISGDGVGENVLLAVKHRALLQLVGSESVESGSRK